MSNSAEEWRPIGGFEGYYEVSDHGRVRSLDRVLTYPDGHLHRLKGRVLSPAPLPLSGHLHLNLKTQHKRRAPVAVHALVLETFVGPRPPGLESLHWDGDPTNNKVTNLRWGTRSENMQDMVRHGRHWQTLKTHCPKGHEYTEANVRIVKGGRECRRCHVEWGRRRPRKPPITHCRRGHEYTPETTRVTDRGRMCLVCFRARMAARRS